MKINLPGRCKTWSRSAGAPWGSWSPRSCRRKSSFLGWEHNPELLNTHGGATEASTRISPRAGAELREISATPRSGKGWFLKKKQKCGDGHATPRTSLYACGRSLRASFGARSGKSAERRRLHGVRAAAQRSSASVGVRVRARACADYRLPPRDPPINRQSIRQPRAGAAPGLEPRR